MQDVGGSSLPNTYGQYANTPDLVVMKRRSSTGDWEAYDTVRGPQRSMSFNTTGVDRNEANGLLGFVPNGFKVGSDSNANMQNVSAVYYSWNRGSIPGFDIVTYRGNSASNHEIPHNLGATPAFGIIKSTYNAGGGPSWHIYHKSVAPTSRLYFETYSAQAASGMWGTGSWNSSNIYVGWDGSNYGTNFGGNTYIGYLWAEVPGFSKFGSYIGNGSTNGPFVNLGFRPKWLMIKNTSYGEQWAVIDTERYPYNDNIAHILFVNSGAAEDLNADYHEVDFLSNGFKVRGASQQLVNYDGHTFVYFAFAESPFKYANAR
jgi:hypothetical protein